MKRSERAAIVQAELNAQFPNPDIPLDHSDAFTLLVAVMLSAQCTDARVNLVTPALFALAPDAASMAQCSPAEILSCIASCGLAKGKSVRLVAMARILVEQHDGQVPDNFKDLESLPGVGHKTASVVMSQAFGRPAFAVDTHIFRVARRWGLSRGDTVEKVEADLKKIFLRQDWSLLHLQMVLWGRHFCPARGCKPTCAICAQVAKGK
ncbi:MAG: endonuclease III [Akkermansia sp.]